MPAGQRGQSLVMHHRDLGGEDADGVPVRRRVGNRLVADHAAAAGSVHDVDRLTEVPLHHARDRPGHGVRASPAPQGTTIVNGRLGKGAGAPQPLVQHTTPVSVSKSTGRNSRFTVTAS